MARPPAGRPNADKPTSRPDKTSEFTLDDVDDELDPDGGAGEVDDEADGDSGRTSATDAFWAGVRIDPVEIALPGGVGYTLRAYRLDSEITPADVSLREDDVPLPVRARGFDDEDADPFADADLEDADEDLEDAADLDDEADGEAEDDGEDDGEDDTEDDGEAEEVPLFLSQAGHLLLFRTPEALVDFVRSDAEHDMSQLDTWPALVAGVRTGYVVPLPDDAYELDLVVQNLRGGHDSWDPTLIVQSGQLARDMAHALRIEPVMLTMASGSPLDDLDEALRSVISGGFGGFRARRKVKRIGEQTATLGWRTIIGKISAVVDWRD